MGVVRFGVCVLGVYAAFLLWAIAQERLSAPFPSIYPEHTTGDKFPSPLFLNFAQATASCLSALIYLTVKSWRAGNLAKDGFAKILGISMLLSGGTSQRDEKGEVGEKLAVKQGRRVAWRKTLPALLLQVSIFQTIAGPIGFLALRHISYPTMVLGKSCKLIPVLLLNVLLYRRRFGAHKYLVVSLVTIGISMFMLFGDGGSKKGGSDSIYGLTLLGIGLFIDGLTNSTQDQIFATYPQFTGQQMMFTMALLTQLLLLPIMLLPLPSHPLSLLHLPSPLASTSPVTFSPPAFLESLHFLLTHPTAVSPLLAYALLGGLGQLFIFETIQHFGSLTLVMVTVTRKLFTMLLSVVVFDHTLSKGQWAGVAVVFAGIGVEAGMKRRDVMRKTRRDKS
ncbi:putative UDP-galactose transporter [Naematelia encephala]|uniref:UDP-galactose transporter homolog 1 n=1 Tax=Naematelia encephala TaxID=71784 RepID=A0A1Y2AXK8_9TREE|nr:putative UDP-galactose transporter [Naematelia encephala]